LILLHRPRIKRISCKGQIGGTCAPGVGFAGTVTTHVTPCSVRQFSTEPGATSGGSRTKLTSGTVVVFVKGTYTHERKEERENNMVRLIRCCSAYSNTIGWGRRGGRRTKSTSGTVVVFVKGTYFKQNKKKKQMSTMQSNSL